MYLLRSYSRSRREKGPPPQAEGPVELLYLDGTTCPAPSGDGRAPSRPRNASREPSSSSGRIPFVINTILERWSPSGQRSRCSGGWMVCWTPLTTTGPSSPTSRSPLTRKTSSPRVCSSMLSQIPNAVQSTAPSKVRETEWVSPTSWGSMAVAFVTAWETGPSWRNSSPASISPKAAWNTRADGLMAPRRDLRLRTASRPAASVFVTMTLSADAICFTDSGLRSRWRSPFTASTVDRTRSTEKWCCRTGSIKIVCRMGAGSARPVVSTTTLSRRGISPRWSRSRSSSSASTRSSRVVQQTHPLPSSTARSSTRLSRWWSSPTSPNSLTSTAVLDIEGSVRTLPSSVVLPLPRKPVTTVTGRVARPPATGLPAPSRGGRALVCQRLPQGRVERVERPAREPFCGGPERAEVLDELRAPLAVAQHVLAAVPVLELQAVVAQDPVGKYDPVGPLAPPVTLKGDGVGAGRGSARPVLEVPVGPVNLGDEILSAEHAHSGKPLGGRPFRCRRVDTVHVDAGVVVRLASRVAPDKVVGDLLHRRPADAVVAVYVVDDALEHEQALRPAAHVRVDGQTVRRVVHLTVDPVELVAPQLLDITRVDEAVGGRRGLYEHHRRQVVEVPVAPDLDEVDLLAPHQGLHPLLGGL